MSKRNPCCTKCSLSNSAIHNKCVWGRGEDEAPIMIIGEAPGASEDLNGMPFCGEAGKLLDFIIAKLGAPREAFYLTNVLRCRPPKNILPPAKELATCLAACREYLDHEIEQIQPRVKVVMGATALQALTGVKMIGMYEGGMVGDYVVSYHPAYALRSPSKEVHIARSLALACDIAGVAYNPKGEKESGTYEYKIRS